MSYAFVVSVIMLIWITSEAKCVSPSAVAPNWKPHRPRSAVSKKTLENLYKERIKYYKKCDLVLSNNLDRKELVRKIKSEIIKYE